MVNIGDVVISIAGRDKETVFLVVNTEGKTAYVADGKVRAVNSLKQKNLKHLKKVEGASLQEFANRIQSGQPVSGKKLHRALVAEKQKRQED